MQQPDMFWITTITETHIGCGTGLGLIDNPIMRHRRNNYPFIPSSSLKGVLKDYHRNAGILSEAELREVFGPEANVAELASGLGILDAELLFFPVRSLAGTFAWITCPNALMEFSYRTEKLGVAFEELQTLFADESYTQLDRMQILLPNQVNQSSLVYNQKVMLEEFSLRPVHCAALNDFLVKVAQAWGDTGISTEFPKKATIVSDDVFAYYITHATAVTPNIRINPETGTTKDGSLRYTEYLMELCLFHSAFTYQKVEKSAEYIRDKFIGKGLNPSVIQVGASETLGKGLIELTCIEGEA